VLRFACAMTDNGKRISRDVIVARVKVGDKSK
jgi:hypothetical protein